MATITNSIGAGPPTRDYSTITAWFNALPVSAVAAGNSYVGQCYNDSEFAENLAPSNVTTDATHTITLTTGPGQSFRDNVNVETNALTYNVANGVGITSVGFYSNTLDSPFNNFTISKLQMKQVGQGFVVRVNHVPSTIDGCILQKNGASNNVCCEVDGGSTGVVQNCLLIQNAAASIGLSFGSGGTANNNTIVKPTGTAGGSGITGDYAGTYIWKNTLVFGFTNDTALANGATFTGSNNLTDAAVPSTSFTAASYTNTFQAINGTDSRTKASSPALGAGTNTGLATDIAGTVHVAGTLYDVGCWQLVPTTVVHTIGSAIGRDYSTLTAWNNAAPANLISAAQLWEGDCYNDSEFVSSGTLLNSAGHTTDTTHTFLLTTGPGQSFRDNAGVQTNALRYNVANGVGIRCTSSYVNTLQLDDQYFKLSKLQIKSSVTDHAMAIASSTNTAVKDPTFDFCIVEGPGRGSAFPASTFISSSGFAVCRNSVFVATFCSAGFGGIITLGNNLIGTTFFYNCTIVNADPGGVLPQACVQLGDSSDTIQAENCAFFSGSATVPVAVIGVGATDPNLSGHAIWTTCMTDSTTFLGTGLTGGKTFANQFVSTTLDYRLKAGADLLDVGTTDAVNASHDIAGTTRPQGSAYDIGAWELVVAVVSGLTVYYQGLLLALWGTVAAQPLLATSAAAARSTAGAGAAAALAGSAKSSASAKDAPTAAALLAAVSAVAVESRAASAAAAALAAKSEVMVESRDVAAATASIAAHAETMVMARDQLDAVSSLTAVSGDAAVQVKSSAATTATASIAAHAETMVTARDRLDAASSLTTLSGDAAVQVKSSAVTTATASVAAKSEAMAESRASGTFSASIAAHGSVAVESREATTATASIAAKSTTAAVSRVAGVFTASLVARTITAASGKLAASFAASLVGRSLARSATRVAASGAAQLTARSTVMVMRRLGITPVVTSAIQWLSRHARKQNKPLGFE